MAKIKTSIKELIAKGYPDEGITEMTDTEIKNFALLQLVTPLVIADSRRNNAALLEARTAYKAAEAALESAAQTVRDAKGGIESAAADAVAALK